MNRPNFSSVESGVTKRGTDVSTGSSGQISYNKFVVFRKRRFLGWNIGEKQFCVCKEIISVEDVISCRDNDEVLGILPKQDFSCALSTKLFEE